MKKVALAVVLGGVLGFFDGLTAWFSPEARDKLWSIVMWSAMKDVIAGFLIGISAVFIRSKPTVALIGLGVGLLLAYLVAMQPDPETGQHYYLQIMLPGALVGLITGYATGRYGEKAAQA